MNNRNINREYNGKKNSDIINFPFEFKKEYLSPIKDKEILKMPLYGYKIIFKILNDISMDQFSPKNIKQSKQLKLFNEELMTQNNTYIRMVFKVTDISKHRDYKEIEKALKFLENFKKDWYKSKNSKGQIIKTLGGLITSPVISKGKIAFLISNYWFSKLVQIPKYNVVLFNTVYHLSNSKQILIYLWILSLKEKGTKINFHNFLKTYDYNYSSPKIFCKNVLYTLKNRLDKYSNKSFNYSIKGDIISIVPYYTKDIQLKLKDKTNIKREITRKLSYWKKRHQLNKSNLEILKSIAKLNPSEFKLLLNAYFYFITECKRKKIKATSIVNDDFMILFQKAIIEVYKYTGWYSINKNAFPKIVNY